MKFSKHYMKEDENRIVIDINDEDTMLQWLKTEYSNNLSRIVYDMDVDGGELNADRVWDDFVDDKADLSPMLNKYEKMDNEAFNDALDKINDFMDKNREAIEVSDEEWAEAEAAIEQGAADAQDIEDTERSDKEWYRRGRL